MLRDGEVMPFNDLQQRLNRKAPGPKMLRDYPAAVRLYDLLRDGAEDVRGLAFVARRRRLTSVTRARTATIRSSKSRTRWTSSAGPCRCSLTRKTT